MSKPKKITDRQLWFIWKSIQSLQGYLGNLVESGGLGFSLRKDYDNGTRAREIIQEERMRRKSAKSKPKKV